MILNLVVIEVFTSQINIEPSILHDCDDDDDVDDDDDEYHHHVHHLFFEISSKVSPKLKECLKAIFLPCEMIYVSNYQLFALKRQILTTEHTAKSLK